MALRVLTIDDARNWTSLENKNLRDVTSVELGAAPAASGDLRLSNDAWVAARNQAGSADVNLMKLTTGDKLSLFNGELLLEPGLGTFLNDLTIAGDLIVLGTRTIINSQTLEIGDNIFVLNNDVTGTPTENAGMEVERGTSTNAQLLWNESSDEWQAGIAGALETIWTAGNMGSGSSLDADTLDTYHASAFPRKAEAATIAGAWVFNAGTWNGTAIGVGYGGTGLTSYTAQDLIYATGATTLAKFGVGANDKVLGVVGGALAWVDQTGGGNLDSLDDVTYASLVDDEILRRVSGGWINQTFAEAGIAAVGHTHTFSSLTSKPTTLSGYGITDAFSSSGGSISGAVFILNTYGLAVGHSALIPISGNNIKFQVLGTGNTDSRIGLGRFTNSTTPARFQFLKSRGSTLGSFATVQTGDGLGHIEWVGDDGTDHATLAARIKVIVEGTVGTGRVPTRMELQTGTDAASTDLTTGVAIDSAQNVDIPNGTLSQGGTAVSLSGHTHTFASLTSKPTTLSGFGITDGATDAELSAHTSLTNNPHTVTKAQVGLTNVENTALSSWAGTTSLTTLGTITAGTWSGTAIAATKGGTGRTGYAVGDILYASSTTALAKLSVGANGHVLTLVAGVPVWVEGGGGGSETFVGLTDTTITSITTGEIIKWSGSAYINNTLAEAGISAVGHTHTFASLTSKPTTLSGFGITDGATDAELSAHTSLTNDPHNVTKAQVGLSNVEDTTLSTWAGSTAITTLGTIATGSIPWTLITGEPSYTTRWPTWTEVTSKPSTFSPSTHTHPWADITGEPTYTTRWPTWSEVTSKPSTFAPSAHNHAWSEITSGVPTYATRWPTHAEVTSKPTYATRWPSFAEVTSKPTTLSGYGITDAVSSGYISGRTLTPDSADGAGVMFTYANSGNKPSGTDHAYMTMSYSNIWSVQMAGDWRTNEWYVRNQNSGSWGTWRTLLHSGNYNSYAPTKTGTGASGTWGISISGNAATATLAANSTLAGGLAIGSGTNNSANQIVRTNASGYCDFGWINTASGVATGTPTRIYCSQDAYIRYYTPASLAPYILNQGSTKNSHTHTFASLTSKPTTLSGYGITDAPTKTGSGASGSWGISVTGSSASCTGLAATASWADQVDVNASNSGSGEYNIMWNSGDTVYSTTGITINRDAKRITATTFSGALSGNATSASYATYSGTSTHYASRTDAATYPVVWASSNPSYMYSCAAVKITSQYGILTATTLRATADIVAYYSSDINLKNNVKVLESPLAKLKQIRGISFDWTDEHLNSSGGEDDYFNRRHDVGVIAQEVQKVLPQAVARKDNGYLGVRYEKLIPLLIEAVKEQQVQIEELQERLAA